MAPSFVNLCIAAEAPRKLKLLLFSSRCEVDVGKFTGWELVLAQVYALRLLVGVQFQIEVGCRT